jgi:hypothetical protein
MFEFAPVLGDPTLFVDGYLNRTAANAFIMTTKLTPVLYAAVIQKTLNSWEVPPGTIRTYESRDGISRGIAEVKNFG